MDPSAEFKEEVMGVDVRSLLKSQSLSPSLREQIQKTDLDDNGVISVDELLKVLKTERMLRRERNLLIRIVSALAVACVLIIAAVAGLTYAVVHLTKDTNVQNNILVSKDTSDAISTASMQATYPLKDWYKVQSMSELEGLTQITIPYGDGVSIFKIQDIHLVPNESIRFDTSSENVSITVTESGISVSGDGRNSSQRRLLLGEQEGTVSGQVIGFLPGCTKDEDCEGGSCSGYYQLDGLVVIQGTCTNEFGYKLGLGSRCGHSSDCIEGTVCGLPTRESRQKECCKARRGVPFVGPYCPGAM